MNEQKKGCSTCMHAESVAGVNLCTLIGSGKDKPPPKFGENCLLHKLGEPKIKEKSDMCDGCPCLDTDSRGRSWCIQKLPEDSKFEYNCERFDPESTYVCLQSSQFSG